MPLPPPPAGVTTEEFDGHGAYEAALAWFDAENRVLHNVIEHGRRPSAEDEHCWKLAWYWAPLLKRRGRLHERARGAAHGAGCARTGSATATRSPTCTTTSAT